VSSLNHQRRRSRTFRVEVLESRALLSAAGVVSRAAAAVASLARVAQVSGIPLITKTNYHGTLTGTFQSKSKELKFHTSGPLDGTPSGAPFWFFKNKGPEYHPSFTGKTEKKTVKSKVTFIGGTATLANFDDTDKINFTFTGEEGKHTFMLKGDIVSGTGSFAVVTGSISADGTFNSPKKGEVTIHLRVYAFTP
jgi:hypothetical protein